MVTEEKQGLISDKTIHAGVVVADLDISQRFNEHAIGMQCASSFDISAEMDSRLGLWSNTPFHVEVLQLDMDDDATQWKLTTFGDRAQTQKNRIFMTG